jgi:hypothetical protein
MTRRNPGSGRLFFWMVGWLVGEARLHLRKKESEYVILFCIFIPRQPSAEFKRARYLLTRKADKRGWYENLLWIHASEWERRQRPVRPQLIASSSYVENRVENRDFFGSTDGNSGERVRTEDAPRAKLSFFLPPAHIAQRKRQKARSKESEREWKHAQSARRAAANCCRHAGLRSPNYAEYAKCNLTAEPNLRLARAHHCEITRNSLWIVKMHFLCLRSLSNLKYFLLICSLKKTNYVLIKTIAHR